MIFGRGVRLPARMVECFTPFCEGIDAPVPGIPGGITITPISPCLQNFVPFLCVNICPLQGSCFYRFFLLTKPFLSRFPPLFSSFTMTFLLRPQMRCLASRCATSLFFLTAIVAPVGLPLSSSTGIFSILMGVPFFRLCIFPR